MLIDLAHIQSFLASVFDKTSDSGFAGGVKITGTGDFGGSDWKIKVRSRGSGPLFMMSDSTGKTNFKSALRLLENGSLMTEGQTDDTFQQAFSDLRGKVTLEFVRADGKKMTIDFDVLGKNRKSAGTASFSFFPQSYKIPVRESITPDKIVGKIPLDQIKKYIDVQKGVKDFFATVDGDNKIWAQDAQDSVAEGVAKIVVAGDSLGKNLAKTVKNALEFTSVKDKEFGEVL